MQSSLFISSFRRILKRAGMILGGIICILVFFQEYVKVVQYPRKNFYDYNNFIGSDMIDVLCVGSSHIYLGINPIQMWDDYGIAAYNLSCSDQAIWFSYYYIKEALKTQKPQVVILDVYTLVGEDEYYYDENRIQANLVNMPLSCNKWKALKTAGTANKVELFFQLPIFHSRYSELNRNDFNINYNGNTDFLGYLYITDIVEYEDEWIEDVRNVKECEPVSEKAEEYLRKCIQLCQSEDINLVLTNTPWPDIKERHQRKYNYIQKIADEYGVPFLNGCLYNDEIGMNYKTDSMGQTGHLNHSGVTKYTKWLVDFLLDHYELNDRRGDQRYVKWQNESDKLKAVIQRNCLRQVNTLDDYFHNILQMENLRYVISLNGDFSRGGVK